MTAAEILIKVKELSDERNNLRKQLDRIEKRIEELTTEINDMTQLLWKEMTADDVVESGNFGHKTRKLDWLVDLVREVEAKVAKDLADDE